MYHIGLVDYTMPAESAIYINCLSQGCYIFALVSSSANRITNEEFFMNLFWKDGMSN